MSIARTRRLLHGLNHRQRLINELRCELDQTKRELQLTRAHNAALERRVEQLTATAREQKVELKAASDRELDLSLRMWGHALP